MEARGCSSVAEHRLPKPAIRVRFPPPAPLYADMMTIIQAPAAIAVSAGGINII